MPVELCGPSGCGFKEGEEECIEKTQTVIGDRPEETCSLDPQVLCKHVTKLVPKLVEVENCFDVPKEICVRSEVNPRKVKKPVIKKWCYVVKCPKECEDAAARQQCPADCETYRGDNKCCYTEPPPPKPQCPDNCAAAFRRGEEEPSCKQYENVFRNCYLPCPIKCRDAFKRADTDSSCEKYNRISGCYMPQFRTPPTPTCPDHCTQAYRDGESDESCAKFDSYLDKCYRPCPTSCEMAYKAGETDPSCEQYSDREKCYLPCPTKCSQDFSREVENPDCAQYRSVENCYYTPRTITPPSPPTNPKACPAKCTNKRR